MMIAEVQVQTEMTCHSCERKMDLLRSWRLQWILAFYCQMPEQQDGDMICFHNFIVLCYH